MSVTALQVCNRAMRLIRFLAQGEAATSEEKDNAFEALNSMVDSWMLERLFIPQVLRTTQVLTASVQDYTIGSGATINIARPMLLQDVGIIPAGVTSEVPIGQFSDDEWAQIRIKSQTAAFPQGVYYNYGFDSSGYGLVSVWPIPTTAPTLVLYTPKNVLTSFSSLSATYVLPPGYERALGYNLAVEIAEEFAKGVVPHGVAAIAMESKANIKRANIRMLKLGCDPATLRWTSDGNGAYNWRTDGFGAGGF